MRSCFSMSSHKTVHVKFHPSFAHIHVEAFGCNVWHTGTCVINQWKEKHWKVVLLCPLVSSLILNNSGWNQSSAAAGLMCAGFH